jgi:hypothetical protein
MNLLNKFFAPQSAQQLPRPTASRTIRPNLPLHAPAAGPAPGNAAHPGRFSNGLKEFLWQLDGIGRGRMLDLGSISQSTLNFFIERGFKIYTEDLLGIWSHFLFKEEEEKRTLTPDQLVALDRSAGAQADRFLRANLRYEDNSFDAILVWDLLDYLDRETVSRVVARLTSLTRDGGVILTIFHTQKPEEFCRYRVLDAHHFELVNAPVLSPPQRQFQNREIQDLFSRFRSTKAFVGRDHLREIVFVK